MRRKRDYFLLILMNFVIYGLNGIFYSYIQQYVGAYQPPIQTGLLVALGPMVTIFAPFFWGVRADKAKHKNTVLLICLIGASSFLSLMLLDPQSFAFLFFTMIGVTFFESAYASICDAVTIGYAQENNMRFGFMRCMGTVAFGCMTMAVSALYEIQKEWFIYAYLMLAAVGLVVVLISPKASGHAPKKQKLDFSPIFKDKKLMIYVAMSCLAQFLWQFYLNLYPSYVTEVMGMSQKAWGLNILLTVAGEAPFFWLMDKIFDRFGTDRVMVFGLVLTCIRYLSFAALTDLVLIQIMSLVTGFSSVVIQYCAIRHIMDHTPVELQATAINVPTILPFGAARMLASILSGFMHDAIGTGNTLWFCFVFSAIGALIYVACGTLQKRRKA